MEKYEENILLSKDDLEKIKSILKGKKFEDFKIHKYYFRDKFVGVIGKEPRHGISLKELKEIFQRISAITRGFKRNGESGYKYTLCYEESKHSHIRVGYFLDETPPKIFRAQRINRNLEKAISKSYTIKI